MTDYAAVAASLRACTDPQKRYAADVIDELARHAGRPEVSGLPKQLREQAGWDKPNANALLAAAREIEEYEVALRLSRSYAEGLKAILRAWKDAEVAEDEHEKTCAYATCEFRGCPHDVWDLMHNAKQARDAVLANESAGVQNLGVSAGAESANPGSPDEGTKAGNPATKPSSGNDQVHEIVTVKDNQQ